MTLFEYLAVEREEMLRYKWIESEKAGRDLGQQALLEWVDKHAAAFHRTMVGRHGLPAQPPCSRLRV
jgi:hypothetical protein